MHMDFYAYIEQTMLPPGMPKSALFQPISGGTEYSKDSKEEFRHCLAQMSQLQEYGVDLPDYLHPSFHAKTGLLPPVLLWGWVVDHEKMYQAIEKEWPHLARRLPYPDPFFVPPKPSASDGEEEEWPLDKSKYEHPGYTSTLYNYSTSLALRRRFGIPDDRVDLLQIKGLFDVQGVYHFGITIGTNYRGVLNETIETEICKFFGIQEEAQWYLDSVKWYWTWHPDLREETKSVQSDSSSAIEV